MKYLGLFALMFAASAFAAPKVVNIQLGTGNSNKEAMVYSMQTIKVKAGAKVKIHFKNNSKSEGVTHNFVLVKPGTAQKVLADAMGASATGWIPKSSDIIVAGGLLNPKGFGTKENPDHEVIEFTAPTVPGDYPYICTFPGHADMSKPANQTMRGVLTVTK
jgi:azurin